MKLTREYLENLVEAFGFSKDTKDSDSFQKKYKNLDNYTITVNFKTEKINYPKPLTLGDKTTSNFEASENFVVLECLNRLLDKGYKPENITLEKKWGLGLRDKGKADIYIKYPKEYEAIPDYSDKSYLIIECKTWGSEFNKEFEKTLKSGGQLLSYYKQETKSELLCLYTSTFEKDEVRFTNRIIEVKEEFQKGGNKDEVLNIWKEQFQQSIKYNGIFDEEAAPYSPVLRNLKRKNLVELQEGDSGYIYNQFAEILRHNVVSDKPNAFNKLFNLILAKIVDEDRGENEELHFQWKDDDSDIDLQKRLNDLYKVGMLDYLNKEITDLSDEELEDLLKDETRITKAFKQELQKRVTELRLYKNNEYSFKEVFNEKSFKDNAVVIKESVKLLQNFQLRYSHKQQFLSNFFELLLSNTLKQEAGQYFTPIPIAKFIVNSMPLKQMVESKLKEGKDKFLPTVIDYACGSGHFLTEAMDEIQQIIEGVNDVGLKPSLKTKIKISKENPYDWARDFVYGIEKDYRLSKISKVSCFLNGDGLANIIHADGLDNFNSDDYKEAPLLRTEFHTKENTNFDVLLANPPYSVAAFVKTLPNGNECFDNFKYFTDQSKEIEVLFIERMKQLVKENGYVGILLPNTIISKSKIYEQARDIIFKYFKIIGLVEFSSGTFMATGTQTVALFLKRRNNIEYAKINSIVKQFFNDFEDTECNGIEEAFSVYSSVVYEIELQTYISFLSKKPNEDFKKTEIYKGYNTTFNKTKEAKDLRDKLVKLNSELIKYTAKKASLKSEEDIKKNSLKITDIEGLILKAEKDLVEKFYDNAFTIEQEKILYFFLAYEQQTILIKSKPAGKGKNEERKFLGYKFSARRGDEGLKIVGQTKLFNVADKLDETKASSYIYKALLGETITLVHPELSNHIQIRQLWQLMKFDQPVFDSEISLTRAKKLVIKSKFPLTSIREITTLITKGTTPTTIGYEFIDKGINFVKVEGITDNGLFIPEKFQFISQECYKQMERSQLKENDILISIAGTFGRIGIVDNAILPANTNQALAIVRLKENSINPKYLFHILKSTFIEEQISQFIKGIAQFNLSLDQVGRLIIPLPPLATQNKIVTEIENYKVPNSSMSNVQQIFDLIKKERSKIILKWIN